MLEYVEDGIYRAAVIVSAPDPDSPEDDQQFSYSLNTMFIAVAHIAIVGLPFFPIPERELVAMKDYMKSGKLEPEPFTPDFEQGPPGALTPDDLRDLGIAG